MNANLLAFVTSECNQCFVGEKRKNFMLTLRDRPEDVVDWAKNNLYMWAQQFVVHGGQAIFCNFYDDPRAIVEHFKQYFATEIKALPTSASVAPTFASV